MTETSSDFANESLVGSIGTFYVQPGARFDLALQTAERYDAAGVPLVAVDASPQNPADAPANHRGTWVQDALEQRGVTVVRADQAGIATQAQQGVAFAVRHGASKVARHEPEKIRMVDFRHEIGEALSRSDVLVIGRTDAAEASLPPVQRRTERLAGWILQNGLHLPADALSGGRGYTAAGAETLADYPAKAAGMNNWIYLYDNVLLARERGLNVGGLSVELTHPPEMVAEETGVPAWDAKRYQQFKLQLDYLLKRPEVDPTTEDIVDVVLCNTCEWPEPLAHNTQEYIDRSQVIEHGLTAIEDYLGDKYGFVPTPR